MSSGNKFERIIENHSNAQSTTNNVNDDKSLFSRFWIFPLGFYRFIGAMGFGYGIVKMNQFFRDETSSSEYEREQYDDTDK